MFKLKCKGSSVLLKERVISRLFPTERLLPTKMQRLKRPFLVGETRRPLWTGVS